MYIVFRRLPPSRRSRLQRLIEFFIDDIRLVPIVVGQFVLFELILFNRHLDHWLPQQTIIARKSINVQRVTITFVSKIVLSGSDWKDNELTAFDITPSRTQSILPLSSTQYNFLLRMCRLWRMWYLQMQLDPQGILPKADRLFFHYMKRWYERRRVFGQRLCCVYLGHNYDESDGEIHNRKRLSFVMCGAVVDAKPDVCVMSESEHLFLVQEDKVFFSSSVPCLMRPLLIAWIPTP